MSKLPKMAIERKHAIRRRAMKRLLRSLRIKYTDRQMYDENALRKLVRDEVIAKAVKVTT